jgi:hypothetical protein
MGILKFDGINDFVLFNGATAALQAVPQAGNTIVAVLKRVTVSAVWNGIVTLETAAAAYDLTLEIDLSNHLFWDNTNASFGGTITTDVTDATDYHLLGASKVLGGAVTFTNKNITTGAAVGRQSSASLGDAGAGLGANGFVRLGMWQTSDPANVWIAVVGIWNKALTNAQVDECFANKRTSDLWNNSAGPPLVLIECNTLTPVDLGGNCSFVSNNAALDATETAENWQFDGKGYNLSVPTFRPLLMTLVKPFKGLPILGQLAPAPTPLTSGPDSISLGDIASAEVVPALNLQDQMLLTGIASSEAVSALNLQDRIALTGIATGEALSALALLDKMNLAGIASAEAVSAITLKEFLVLTGIASAEAVGALKLTDFITLAGIASGENVPALRMPDQIFLSGIASAENVPAVSLGATDTINLTGIATGEAVSAVALKDLLTLAGVASGEALSAVKLTDQLGLSGIISGEIVPGIFQPSINLVGIASAESVPGVTLTEPGVSTGNQTRLLMTGVGN